MNIICKFRRNYKSLFGDDVFWGYELVMKVRTEKRFFNLFGKEVGVWETIRIWDTNDFPTVAGISDEIVKHLSYKARNKFDPRSMDFSFAYVEGQPIVLPFTDADLEKIK